MHMGMHFTRHGYTVGLRFTSYLFGKNTQVHLFCLSILCASKLIFKSFNLKCFFDAMKIDKISMLYINMNFYSTLKVIKLD